MNEPRRLLDDDEGGSYGRSLLRSARDDAPSAGARRKTMVALGLAGGVGAAVTATSATGAASTLVKSGGTAALLKWIGMGVLGGVITVGTITIVQQPRTADAPAHTASTATAKPVEPQKAALPPAPAPVPAPEPTAEDVAPKPVASAPAPVTAKPAPTSLTDEVASLDTARVALSSGNAAGALRALDEHDRRFPGGMLGQEAMVMRIEALVMRGDRATASRLGNAFLEAHPRSPSASRVRSLLGVAPVDPAP